MPPRRRIRPEDGASALAAWSDGGEQTSPSQAATAVRFTLEELSVRHPGRSVEVRVPPFGATQCIAGPVHRRGTPANVVETDAATWLAVATGTLAWHEAVEAGRVRCSGTRADLSDYLPLSGTSPG